jgi:hypothetical protein
MHSAEVLPAALRTQPGIPVDLNSLQISGIPSTSSLMQLRPTVSPLERVILSNSSDFDVEMSDGEIQPSGNNHMAVSSYSATTTRFNQNEGHSSGHSAQQLSVQTQAVFHPSTLGINYIRWGAPSAEIAVNNALLQTNPGHRQPRRCKVCSKAGREGLDCPGRGNRAKCKYI